ncbi:relaxase domain-containing protein [Scleromatobacter humisilvae]|uniref:Relaxase domain-containing protein n=1 Tax=Scleromatobacter humisilvae TaxID=2897159 RepID=A0A9X2C3D4_9BURK|nr:relaxase domain-containing protein [Scleromatobacter humisilvae]MCK9687290.1 relaxase domain-containing protein [Scleromatobacter humisilvae]
MIGRPRPISLIQALGYFLRESQGFEQLIEHQDFPPEFGGALLPALGLSPGPFTLQQYTEFVLGDFPALRERRLRMARETHCSPEELTRAVYEVAVSLPKSISLQLLVSGDRRLNDVVRDANRAVMDMFARYCFVRVTGEDGFVDKVPVTGLAYASWWHISSRERDPDEAAEITGGADPQLHIHNLVHRLVLPAGAVGVDGLLELGGKDVQIAHQSVELVSKD